MRRLNESRSTGLGGLTDPLSDISHTGQPNRRRPLTRRGNIGNDPLQDIACTGQPARPITRRRRDVGNDPLPPVLAVRTRHPALPHLDNRRRSPLRVPPRSLSTHSMDSYSGAVGAAAAPTHSTANFVEGILLKALACCRASTPPRNIRRTHTPDLKKFVTPNTRFVSLDKVGEGKMGSVYLAAEEIGDAAFIAKTMKKKKHFRPEKEANEAAVSSEFNRNQHHVVTYFGTTNKLVPQDEGEETEEALIFSYMAGGDLLNLSKTLREHLNGNLEQRNQAIHKIFRITLQGLIALRYFSEIKLVHRDIKEDNFLVDEKGNVYLGDLGCAYQTTRPKPLYIEAGSPCSAYDGTHYQDWRNTPASDLFAFGHMLLRLLADPRALRLSEQQIGDFWHESKDSASEAAERLSNMLLQAQPAAFAVNPLEQALHDAAILMIAEPNARPTAATLYRILSRLWPNWELD